MANVWQQFQSLLETESTQIATVITTDGQRSTVELLSGDTVRVTGTGAPGSRVYIKGMQITEQAPNLPSYNMILF
ncbi:MAG: hypothetical protein ACK4L8_16155 [Nitrincola lacisaponensis]|uniref:hypothetical protein n=1 Tax=Nitrincola lacisaponensis TaxID=267850 RepID=UPI00391BE8FB